MPIPDEIGREHIIQALRALHSKRDIPQGCESTKYDLHFGGERFPPKYVIRLAHSFVRPGGQILASFKGAKMARDFLRRRNFELFDKAGNKASD